MTSPVDDLDAQADQRLGVGVGPGQRPHVVAPLDQQLADVGAGQSGGAGDEDRLAHAEACCERVVGLAASTWSAL